MTKKLSAVILGAAMAFASPQALRAETFTLEEATIEQIQKAMADGALTSADLVSMYLNRIAIYDRGGIKLNALPVLNPKVFDEASPAERKAMPKISSASAFFVEDALTAAAADPAFMPPYVSVPELEKDYALFKQFTRVITPLASLAAAANDTTTAVGSEAYVAALSYYNSVKRAAKDGAPGAQVIYERLKKRFESEPEAPAPPTP